MHDRRPRDEAGPTEELTVDLVPTPRFGASRIKYELLNKGLVDVSPLISATLSYRDSARAFALAADRSQAIKVLLNFD